jgi:hypothetical protein
MACLERERERMSELLMSNCSVLFLSLPLDLILGHISVLNMGDTQCI